MSIANAVSSRVAGNRTRSSVVTGRPVTMESPRSPLSSVLEEEPVLDEDRLVETHVLPDLLDLLLGGLLAQHDLGRVSGDGAHHEEHDDGHPEQHRNDLQDPASGVLNQGLDLRPNEKNSQRYSASTVRLRF